MRFYFTKWHAKALEAKKVQPSFSKKLRMAIRQTLVMYSNTDNYQNYTFEATEETLLRFYGEHRLPAYNVAGQLAPSSLNGFIL